MARRLLRQPRLASPGELPGWSRRATGLGRLEDSPGGGLEESALAIASAFHADETALAVADALLVLCEGDARSARQELQQLRPALRRNAELRQRVLEAGPAGAEALARQDRQEWATEELQNKRRRWAEEVLRDAILPQELQDLLSKCWPRR